MTIHIQNINAGYGKKNIIENVSLSPIEPGEFIGLIGPNAAGKSTLFRCLAGFHSCQGEVSIHGHRLGKIHKAQWNKLVGMMPQHYDASIALTIFDSILLALKSHGDWRVSEDNLNAVEEVLKDLNITHLANTMLHSLSGGQKQLSAIARLLVRRSPLLLLDEPTSALDLHRQLDVMHVIRNLLRKCKIAAIIIMHDLNLAAEFCDRLVLLDKGKIQIEGTPETVLAHPIVAQTYQVNIALEKTSRRTYYADRWLTQ